MELKSRSAKTDILYIYGKLAASFTRLKGFDGWMIAKAEFKAEKIKNTSNNTYDGPEINNKFIKQRKVYSVISANTIYNSTEYILIMHIVKPGSISGINNFKPGMPEVCYMEHPCLFTLEYTIDDIKKYIEYTGDSNPVHQSGRPVVPGFLIFGDMLSKELYKNIADNSVAGYTISFRNQLFADETIEIYKLGGNGKIIALQTGLNQYTSYKWELYPVQKGKGDK